jgi:hypothetical protein
MIGLFMLNGKPPHATARSPSRNPWVTYSNRKRKGKVRAKVKIKPWAKKSRSKRVKHRIVRAAKRFVAKRRKGWRDESRAHAVAAKIGWTYRKYAADFRRFGAHAARGTTRGKHRGLTISERSLGSYRKTRRTSVRRLEGRREWYKHRATKKRTYMGAVSRAKRKYGMLYNKTAYQRFIGRMVKGARGRADARRRFRAAVKAWKRRKHNDNPVLPISYSNRKKRRHHSNAVLPISYSNRRKRRKGHRRNPLYRSASGRFARRGGRKLRRYKGGGWRSNPLFRSKSGRYARRGSHRLHRIRGGGWHANGLLPYTAFSNPVDAVMGTFAQITNVDVWTKTVLPITIGFIGTHAVALGAVKMIAPAGTKFEGIVKHGARAASAIVLSAVTGIVTRDTDMAAKVLAGGLVALLGGVVADLIGPDYTKATGLGEMNDLADDLTEELKSRIAAGVRAQFSDEGEDGSIGSFLTAQDLKKGTERLGDFVTSQALQKATAGSGLPSRAGGGPPRAPETADLGTFQDALADGSLI